jgi:t-SNARE complex subunit (syntaxin)
MRTLRILLAASTAAASLISAPMLRAQVTPPPIVVPQDRSDKDLLRDLQGAPKDIQTLILSFDKQRDQYLQQQRQLLIKLKSATTDQEREAIRDQLQANRREFLADLKTFRQDLKTDIKADKANITHAELRRILDAARDAATDGSPRHKGH